MNCPYCDHDNLPDAGFCVGCSRPLHPPSEPLPALFGHPGEPDRAWQEPGARAPGQPSPAWPPKKPTTPWTESPKTVLWVVLGVVGILVVFGSLALATVGVAMYGIHRAQRDSCGPTQVGECRRLCDAPRPQRCHTSPMLPECQQAAQACNALGWAHQRGDGATRDPVMALRAFERSCGHGFPGGCDSVGYMYQNGHGGRTESDALQKFREVCAQKEPAGCVNEALMTYFGRGAPPDQAGARQRIEQHCDYVRSLSGACEQQAPEECGMFLLVEALGACGKSRDLAWAESQRPLACPAGYRWPCDRLDELTGSP